MRKQILITGSSFVPPIPHIWQTLTDFSDVTFTNIGNTAEILDKSNAEKSVAFIFFLTDFDSSKEDTKKVVESQLSLIEQRLNKSNTPFVFCFSNYGILDLVLKSKWPSRQNQFTDKLQQFCDQYKHFYTINLDELFADFAFSKIYSQRNWYFARTRLTNAGWEHLSKAISEVLVRVTTAPKKVLILDCDNTLWGGVIGEDGIRDIALGQDGVGQAHKDFQKAILELHKRGTLIGLASKNNEEDVWDVFDNHPDMVLSRDHIITSRINWDDKHIGLSQMAKELNLGLESFAFWDDNNFERDQMRKYLPEVETIGPPNEVENWPVYLKKLSLWSHFSSTQEDFNKQEQYRLVLKFTELRNKSKDLNEYLATINMSAKVVSINEYTLARAEQISMKTNQFNLRSVRHTSSEISEFISKEENFGFLVKLNDSFGEHGLVALVLVSSANGIAFVESFNMSCRVFGRNLEYWIVLKIQEKCSERGINQVIFEYVPTDKSKLVTSTFMKSSLFERISDPIQSINGISHLLSISQTKGDFFVLHLDRLDKDIERLYGR